MVPHYFFVLGSESAAGAGAGSRSRIVVVNKRPRRIARNALRLPASHICPLCGRHASASNWSRHLRRYHHHHCPPDPGTDTAAAVAAMVDDGGGSGGGRYTHLLPSLLTGDMTTGQ